MYGGDYDDGDDDKRIGKYPTAHREP